MREQGATGGWISEGRLTDLGDSGRWVACCLLSASPQAGAPRSRKRMVRGCDKARPVYALHPSYTPVPEVDVCLRGCMEDLEKTFGRYCSRTAPAFERFLYARADFPLITTTLPFLCAEQLLFMISQTPRDEMFERVSCPSAPSGCVLQVREGCRVDQWIRKLQSKLGPRGDEFAQLAYAILAKEATDVRMFVAVYVGPQGSKARLQRGPVTDVPAYRAHRTFQWGPSPAARPIGPDGRPSLKPMLHITVAAGGAPSTRPMCGRLLGSTAMGEAVGRVLDDAGFPSLCVRRALDCFGNRMHNVLVRAYLVTTDPSSVPYVTLHITRNKVGEGGAGSTAIAGSLLTHYDVLLAKKLPWTNIKFGEETAAAREKA